MSSENVEKERLLHSTITLTLTTNKNLFASVF